MAAGESRDHGGQAASLCNGTRDAGRSAWHSRRPCHRDGDRLDKEVKLTGLATRSLGVRAGARPLVSELSVEFRAGEMTAILGRNGSGKTLTLHTLAGLRRPQQGLVRLDG